MGLFGKSKPADPKALVDEWTKKIRKEGYGLDRQIRQIQRQLRFPMWNFHSAQFTKNLALKILLPLPPLI